MNELAATILSGLAVDVFRRCFWHLWVTRPSRQPRWHHRTTHVDEVGAQGVMWYGTERDGL